MQQRLKKANLPKRHDLEEYDYSFSNGLSKQRIKDLRSLLWVEQNANLLLMGPCGVGKTFIAAGLAYQALKAGYKVVFQSMQELIHLLKMKEASPAHQRHYQQLLKVNLLVIDDMMMFPLEKPVATSLFQLINHLHEQTSIIITTNKSPKQWAEVLQDEVLATAILDRLLQYSEMIHLSGDSYRMLHRKTVFPSKKQTFAK